MAGAPATTEPPKGTTRPEIDQRVFDLYDEYCHGRIDRREFLLRAAAVTAGGLAMAQALMPRYAAAQTISFTNPRIRARYVSYASPGGNSGQMRGYLVQPAGAGPFPAVLVIHENRALNSYVEDVARRLATDGFLALAPDGLAPVGGYPGTQHCFHNHSTPRYHEAAAKLSWERTLVFFRKHLARGGGRAAMPHRLTQAVVAVGKPRT